MKNIVGSNLPKYGDQQDGAKQEVNPIFDSLMTQAMYGKKNTQHSKQTGHPSGMCSLRMKQIAHEYYVGTNPCYNPVA